MSAPQQGLKLAKDAQVLTERMQDGVLTSAAPQGGAQGGAQAVSFPRKFDARSKYDDEMNTKLQLMDETGMTPFGQVYYDDKVGRWLEKKAATAEAANFDSYFATNFNKNDLASRQWAQEIHPEFYRAREREMIEKADIVLKLKGIQLRGPQNKEDLHMLYLIESGRVKLPEDWDKIGPGFSGTKLSKSQEKQQQQNYWSGLIRFPLFLTDKQRKTRAENSAAIGAWGSAASSQNMFYTGEPPRVYNRNNKPLSKHENNEDTLGFNFQNFLRQGQ